MDPIELLDSFGFPVAMSSVLLLAFWRMARWFAGSVAEPFIESHTKFLDKIELHLASQSKTQSKQGELLESLADSQNKIVDLIKEKS